MSIENTDIEKNCNEHYPYFISYVSNIMSFVFQKKKSMYNMTFAIH